MNEKRRSRPKFSISESSDSSCYTADTQFTDLDDEERDIISTLPMLNRTYSTATNPMSVNSCSNYQKCEQVLKSYTKLKIYFMVLCVVNVLIILLVCIFFAVFFLRFSNQTDIKSSFGQQQSAPETKIPKALPQTQNDSPNRSPMLNISCASLKHKLKWSRNSTAKHCSLDDLIDAVIQFVKPNKQVLHLIGGELDTHGDQQEYDVKNWQRKTPSSDLANKHHGIEHNTKKGTIVIDNEGFYFVYSRLAFSLSSPNRVYSQNARLQNMDINHSIRKKQLDRTRFEKVQETSIKCSNHSFVHGSYLERVVYLSKGDEIKVVVSYTGHQHFDQMYKTENYFGAFLL